MMCTQNISPCRAGSRGHLNPLTWHLIPGPLSGPGQTRLPMTKALPIQIPCRPGRLLEGGATPTGCQGFLLPWEKSVGVRGLAPRKAGSSGRNQICLLFSPTQVRWAWGSCGWGRGTERDQSQLFGNRILNLPAVLSVREETTPLLCVPHMGWLIGDCERASPKSVAAGRKSSAKSGGSG